MAGPEEVASLAHDFNEMTDALVERSAQLQESEQHFRYVLDVSRDFIYKSNLQTGTYDYVSPSVLELTGFTPEEVVAMGLGGVAERIHPEDGKRLTGEIKNLTKDWDEGQRSAISVYRSKRKDGEYRWFSDNSVFVRYSNEQPATMIGAIRDITAQKQAEEALRESEHDLKERAKELNCLYGISNLVQRPDISLEEILQGTANLIPPAWQYPEITCARIVLGGQEYLSGSFRETAWRQTSDIIVNGERIGAVEVCYLEEKPESDEGPFLTEERSLVNAIAERLGRVIERRQVEQTLREARQGTRRCSQAPQTECSWPTCKRSNSAMPTPRCAGCSDTLKRSSCGWAWRTFTQRSPELRAGRVRGPSAG